MSLRSRLTTWCPVVAPGRNDPAQMDEAARLTA